MNLDNALKMALDSADKENDTQELRKKLNHISSLINQGADINKNLYGWNSGMCDWDDYTALVHFIKNPGLVNFLLKNGADVNKESSDYSVTPLSELISWKNSFHKFPACQIANLLLRYGADMNMSMHDRRCHNKWIIMELLFTRGDKQPLSCVYTSCKIAELFITISKKRIKMHMENPGKTTYFALLPHDLRQYIMSKGMIKKSPLPLNIHARDEKKRTVLDGVREAVDKTNDEESKHSISQMVLMLEDYAKEYGTEVILKLI